MDLEISKMLTISTNHIKQETGEFLYENYNNSKPPICYNHDEFGFFVFCNRDYMKSLLKEQTYTEIPHDLLLCMVLARTFDCDWLCLDGDGPIVKGLQTYEWE